MVLLRRGQDAAQAETWIRLENGALLHQSKNPRYAAGRQTVCEPGDSLPRCLLCAATPHHALAGVRAVVASIVQLRKLLVSQ